MIDAVLMVVELLGWCGIVAGSAWWIVSVTR